MILIIANREDVHTILVAQRLREMGEAVHVFDASDVPSRMSLSAAIEPDGARLLLGDFDPAEVRTVWLRRLALLRPAESLSEEDAEFAKRESKSMLSGMAQLLGERYWVNPLEIAFFSDRGHGKLLQLERAREVGLEIPRTLATNDPDAARAFVRSCPDGAIYKPFMPPTRKVVDGDAPRYGTVYTTRIGEAALAKMDGVRHAPCQFQELIPKRCDLRVIVMGDRVFATEIHSQADERSALDFRQHYALGQTPYAPHELPDTVAAQCVAVNRAMGLRFGAIDIVLTPDGRYVFLEVNQQGQFLWLEGQTGQPLLDNFCEFLRQARPDFSCDAPLHEPGLPEIPDAD